MELFSGEWFAALIAIILVDLMLAGDNAVVIALAARNLPAMWKRRAIIWGTAGAIVVRIALAFFLTRLLQLPGLGIVGGLILYVIAWRLINQPPEEDANRPAANSFWAAMGTIIVADTVMGLDNVLAIAGAARGDLSLIVIGLALSIPIMMGGSVLILRFFDRMPWLITAGSALLAGIAGRIILDDPWMEGRFGWSFTTQWSAIALVGITVTALAVWYSTRKTGNGKKA